MKYNFCPFGSLTKTRRRKASPRRLAFFTPLKRGQCRRTSIPFLHGIRDQGHKYISVQTEYQDLTAMTPFSIAD